MTDSKIQHVQYGFKTEWGQSYCDADLLQFQSLKYSAVRFK